jgi:hypothetical protein
LPAAEPEFSAAIAKCRVLSWLRREARGLID